MAQSRPVLEHFIAITRRIIAQEGFENYAPTLLLPQRKDVRVLEDIPPEADLEAIVTRWACRIADPAEDFICAFKVDAHHFKVIARIDGNAVERVCVKSYPC